MIQDSYVALPHPSHPKILNNAKLFKIPVVVKVNNIGTEELAKMFWLIAPSPQVAANWVRDTLASLPNTEIWAWGPRGGQTYRYVGWESAVGHSLRCVHLTEEEQQDRINLIFED